MLTDRDSLQEESTVLGTPCLTLRWNTERPVTLREHGGASVLTGNNIESIRKAYQETLRLKRKPQRPEKWDGNIFLADSANFIPVFRTFSGTPPNVL